jgi:hypothetical protein
MISAGTFARHPMLKVGVNDFVSFQADDLGIQLRSIIGVENLATSPGSGACLDENRNTRLGVGRKKMGRRVMTALRTRS